MRLIRILSVCALGMVAGCGGCDSCFGPAPGDDAATPTATGSSPLVVADGAVAPRADSDGGSDAGATDAAKDAWNSTPLSVPRPKAPMPIGAYQSCGVYDGPLCTKECANGNCRQDCDGVKCELTCKGGYCSQLCGPAGECKLTCKGGHCVQVCTKPEGCTKECAGGDCQ